MYGFSVMAVSFVDAKFYPVFRMPVKRRPGRAYGVICRDAQEALSSER
jgi:hypothetical protein